MRVNKHILGKPLSSWGLRVLMSGVFLLFVDGCVPTQNGATEPSQPGGQTAGSPNTEQLEWKASTGKILYAVSDLAEGVVEVAGALVAPVPGLINVYKQTSTVEEAIVNISFSTPTFNNVPSGCTVTSAGPATVTYNSNGIATGISSRFNLSCTSQGTADLLVSGGATVTKTTGTPVTIASAQISASVVKKCAGGMCDTIGGGNDQQNNY